MAKNTYENTYISLFSGYGGLDLAVRCALPEARCVCYVERETPAAAILASRMEDGGLEDAPIWSDIVTFPSRLFRGRVAGLVGGSPARTSALQADRQESRESGADCSLRSSDSFASWNPSSGCFSRTSRQFSIFQQEQPFLENLPRSGSMRNGELYERPMLADRTGESGRLCWPTARAQDSKHGKATDYEMSREEGLDLLHVKVERMMRTNWHTPSTEDHKSDGPNAQGRYGTEQMKTSDQRLRNQVWNWPTPQARDVKSPDMEGSGNYERKIENGWTIDLNSAAANWLTPKARDSKSAEGQAGMMRNDPDLNVIASRFSLPVPPTSTHGGKSPSGSTRRLNPDFVDWLMGLIPGWTDYAPLETASYLSRVRSLLRSYSGGLAE